jgi:hypothetical protein
VPVFSEKQSDKLGMYGFVAAEVTSQESAYEISINGSVIAWEMDVFQ